MCFCDVSNIMANSKILIVSGATIRVIFQNLVTYYRIDGGSFRRVMQETNHNNYEHY